MFGRPEWFREKRVGWGLVPIHWRGWLYTGGWMAALGGPFFLLVHRHQPLEAIIWVVAALALLVYDVRAIRRASRRGASDVLYIGDDAGEPEAGRRFAFQWRR